MRKFMGIGMVTVGLLMASSSMALAAQPNNQACLGKDASQAAQALGRDLGQTLAGTAKSAPGAIGTEVQLHLAGQIPDEAFPNSCND